MICWFPLLALTCACHADILIGDKPCLWKRAVTEYKCRPNGQYDTLPMDQSGRLCFRGDKKCKEAWLRQRCTWGTDTTGWETYWAECPRGKK